MSINASNAVIALTVATLFPTPVQLQGFSTDDVVGTEALTVAETMMGVDGFLSAGFVFNSVDMNIMLQADSRSNRFFDTWNNTNQSLQDTLEANGTIILKGIQTKFNLTRGFLKTIPIMPDVKKVIQPRRFMITWQRIAPQNV